MLWITKEGDAVEINKMSFDHLVNSYKATLRTINSISSEMNAGWSLLSMLQGEMAIDSVENGLGMLDGELERLIVSRDNLAAEIKKRSPKVFRIISKEVDK